MPLPMWNCTDGYSKNQDFVDILFYFLIAQEMIDMSESAKIKHNIDELYDKVLVIENNQKSIIDILEKIEYNISIR